MVVSVVLRWLLLRKELNKLLKPSPVKPWDSLDWAQLEAVGVINVCNRLLPLLELLWFKCSVFLIQQISWVPAMYQLCSRCLGYSHKQSSVFLRGLSPSLWEAVNVKKQVSIIVWQVLSAWGKIKQGEDEQRISVGKIGRHRNPCVSLAGMWEVALRQNSMVAPENMKQIYHIIWHFHF